MKATMIDINKRLSEIYSEMKSGVNIENEVADHLSCPLLMYVTDKWVTSDKKILIVGQETLGWGETKNNEWGYDWIYDDLVDFNNFKNYHTSVEALMHLYKIFEFSLHQRQNYNGPFFRAYREVRKSVENNVDGINTSVLWTNLFKMSFDGGSVNVATEKEREEILDVSRGMLHKELETLKPDVVVFFTGPQYNDSLYSIFNGVEKISYLGYDPEKTAKLSHDFLPKNTWRTYHPSYLQRSKKWEVIDNICDDIKCIEQ
jgi:hypothetical protein